MLTYKKLKILPEAQFTIFAKSAEQAQVSRGTFPPHAAIQLCVTPFSLQQPAKINQLYKYYTDNLIFVIPSQFSFHCAFYQQS